ncbi:ribosome maturation factor RimP [Hyphococcus sp. DH-69]|uniref:ribosome maturation factor RimP n=1 Tax=Hyphococcus formosus TaxID=3143534 RepID=UPI00398AD28C
MTLENRIAELITPVVADLGFELVRIRITGGQTKTLQIMAERPDHTMSAAECAQLSRALSPVLEEADPISGHYNLEVSSPGIDRPLVREKDFADWQGWPAKLELNQLVEGRKRFKGVLAGIDEGKVAFDIDGEDETALFPMEWIANAQLVLTDELIKKTMKADNDDRPNLSDQDDQQGDDAMETSQ